MMHRILQNKQKNDAKIAEFHRVEAKKKQEDKRKGSKATKAKEVEEPEEVCQSVSTSSTGLSDRTRTVADASQKLGKQVFDTAGKGVLETTKLTMKLLTSKSESKVPKI